MIKRWKIYRARIKLVRNGYCPTHLTKMRSPEFPYGIHSFYPTLRWCDECDAEEKLRDKLSLESAIELLKGIDGN